MKRMTQVLAGILVSALLVGTFCACGKKKEDMTNVITQADLAANAAFSTADGAAAAGGAFSGGAGAYVEVNFPQETTCNTVAIRAADDAVKGFEIAARIDGVYQTVYANDKISTYRYCAFPAVKTDSLRVTVTQATDTFSVNSIGVYQIEDQDASGFRVTSYIVADRIYEADRIEPADFDVITDAILFGSVVFDENGTVKFHDSVEVNGEKKSGQEVFETALQNLRAATQGKTVRIYLNILGPDGSNADWNKAMKEKGALHKKAMKDNQAKMVDAISALLDQYDLDGIFFDWEYPIKSTYWNVFDSFVIALKEKIGDKKLGAALAPWDAKFSKEALACVDMIELMTYDLFDNDGFHSNFYNGAASGVADLVNRGIPVEKIDLGVPFYARPTDSAALWFDYSQEAATLGKYGNLATGTLQYDQENETQVSRYYNGYQMVYDKTAYALSAGLGGMMVWHYSCDLPYDNELSLFRAMGDAIRDRT